jgi:hypothetical protein
MICLVAFAFDDAGGVVTSELTAQLISQKVLHTFRLALLVTAVDSFTVRNIDNKIAANKTQQLRRHLIVSRIRIITTLG